MSVEAYTLDTNILVYAFDREAGMRHHLAKQVIEQASQGRCILTLQAVSEFYAVATRKRVMQPNEASSLALAFLDLFQTAVVSATAVRAALAEASSRRASYWDALLVAAAAEAGCSTILTEDLSNGVALLGLRVINPFAGDSLSPAAAAILQPR